MKKAKLSEMKGGWFVGDFEPTVWRDKNFEVGYKFNFKGEQVRAHIHKVSTEISVLLHGKCTVQGQVFESGDIIILEPGDLGDPEFLEDCEFLVVKVPSVIGDKYEV